MGVTQSQNQKYQDLELIEVIEPHKMIMRCNKTSQLYYRLENTFPTNQDLEKYSQKVKKRSQLTHQYYLNPLTYFLVSHNNFCSKQYKFVQIYHHESHTLQKEIQNRKHQGKNFNLKEIWSILCSCVLVMAHFERNQFIHYTLNPKDIILTEDGFVKVLAMELSDFVFDHTFKPSCYYSPQMLKALRNASIFTPNNKSGVFTLGMTILSLAINENLADVYDESLSINSGKLTKKINAIANDDIRDCLGRMLKIAQYERLTFPEIQEMLFSILQKNHHDDDDPINKLQESILKVNTDKFIPYNFCMELHHDLEDTPSYHYQLLEEEAQVLDEPQNQKYTQMSVISEHQQSHTNVLADKSNLIYTQNFTADRKSSTLLEKFKNNNISSSSSSHCQYVTEQYSRGRYEGYKQSNMREGFGTFYYDEGGRYTGQWKHNQMQGRGALYYTNGEIAYEGEWMADQLHGSGVLYNEFPEYISTPFDGSRLDLVDCYWVKYEGNFENDLRSGKGSLFLTNGEYYEGEFKDDLVNGNGTFFGLGGKNVNGIWQDGKLKMI